jgi:hypothetical protein
MSDKDDDVFFTLDPDNLAEIFITAQQKLAAGEITLERANWIGSNMPEGWEFEFEQEDDE